MAQKGEISELLASVSKGHHGAWDRLVSLVYEDLRALAHRQLQRLRPGQTLDTTALVHEAYLKLGEPGRVDWLSRTHFMAVAATAMRYIVVDHARARAAKKRGGDVHHTSLDPSKLGTRNRAVEILALDEALEDLAALNERLARVVELIYFGGLTKQEAGAVLGVTERTVARDWRKARAFLHRALEEQAEVAVE